MNTLNKPADSEELMDLREQIADVLRDFYLEASTRKITREEFEQFIDRILALFEGGDHPNDTTTDRA